jgi:hypothetical protein
MGQYDAEVEEARKLIDKWINSSKGYHDKFISLKKDSLVCEKPNIQEARVMLDSKRHRTDPRAAEFIEDAIASGNENLDKFHELGQRLFKEHYDWSMSGPRDGFVTIARQLKFGSPGEERFDGIQKELGPTLEIVSKALRETERVWNTDVKFAIENQRSKLKAIAKEFAQDSPSSAGIGGHRPGAQGDQDLARKQALGKQMEEAIESFKEVTDKGVTAILFVKDKLDLEKVNTKNGEFFEKMVPFKRKEKYIQYKNKLALIPKTRETIIKNFGRVQKAFPPDYLAGVGKTGFDKIVEIKEEASHKLTSYENYYKMLMIKFERRHWN